MSALLDITLPELINKVQKMNRAELAALAVLADSTGAGNLQTRLEDHDLKAIYLAVLHAVKAFYPEPAAPSAFDDKES